MKTTLMIGATLMAVITAAPGMAQMSQGSMSSDMKMKMSSADMKKMKSCQNMSRATMMKNKGCMKMMKMHPDMMKGGMMKDGTMSKNGG